MHSYAKFTWVFLFWAMVHPGQAAAQTPAEMYSFGFGQGTYAPLVNPVVLNPGIDFPGHNNYTVQLGFEFRYFGNPLYSIEVLRNGLVFLGNENEYLTPFRPEMVVTPQSQIAYQVSTTGNCNYRVMKVEWKNMGLMCADSLTGRVNFQLWLYESSNRIEFHYGPVTGVPASGTCNTTWQAYLGPRLWVSNSRQYAVVTGNFAQPVLLQGIGSFLGNEHPFQQEIPPEGMVYTFTLLESQPETPFSLGPNPTSGELRIRAWTNECEPYRITLTDLWGRVYFQSETTNPQLRLNLGAYQPGWYLIRIFYPDSGVFQNAKVLLTR